MRPIVYVLEQAYSERNHARFGYDHMTRRGYDVRIFDVGRALWPRVPQTSEIDQRRYPFVSVFDSAADAERAIAALDPDTFLFVFVEFTDVAWPIYRAITKAGLDYTVGTMNSLPAPPALTIAKAARIARLLRHPVESLGRIVSRLRFEIARRLTPPRPASLLLAGGTDTLEICNYPRDEKTDVIWVHALDFDRVIEQLDEPRVTEPVAVFIDEFRPFHPDYAHATQLEPPEPEAYYESLNRFFDRLENATGLRVVIAAHPRSDYHRRDRDWYAGREVIRDQTLRLVRRSRLVVTHMSTALNWAVLFRKPLMFITTESLELSAERAYQRRMSAILGKPIIDVDRNDAVDWNEAFAVDEIRYADYEHRFIKHPDSPRISTWEIIARWLASSEPAETRRQVR